MKKINCLLSLWMLTVFLVSGQTIRLAGTLNGPKKYYDIHSDGTGFRILETLPSSSLESEFLEASDKLIYGASRTGGANGSGFIYRMFADGRNFEIIHTFDLGIDTKEPNGDLIEGADGKIYGTAYGDGTANGTVDAGAIFRLDKDGSNFEILHYLNFSNGDGEELGAGLLEASDGLLYGTTESRGANGGGTLFRINRDGTNFTVLRDFVSATDGCCLSSKLIENNGVIYGVNTIGGTSNQGTIYSYTIATGSFAVVGNIDQGTGVNGKLIFDSGFIYGLTTGGNTNGRGAVFVMNPSNGAFSTLYAFASTHQGARSLMMGSNGRLYGVIQLGGSNGVGSIFELTTTGTFSEFHDFVSPDGQPIGGLIEIINTPPTLIAPVTNASVVEDGTYTLDISTVFAASDEPAANVEPSITNVSNSGLFNTTSIQGGVLSLEPVANAIGSSDITLRATDSRGDFTETTFTLSITPEADDPTVTDATTTYKTLSTNGLVVSKNVVDGLEVTHFKVTNIINGMLFLNDGTTSVHDGDFVTFTQGSLGLRFFPTMAGTSSFTIQASTSANDIGLGGSTETASIIADKALLTASVENASRTYGMVNPDFNFAYTGFLDGDDISAIDTPPTGTSVGVTADVGSYTISGSGGSDDNYDFNYVDGALTVSKADLLVTADDKIFRYGDSQLPELTFNYSGFRNGDTSNDIDSEPTGLATNATVSSPFGSYQITVNQDAVDNNYDFSYIDGELTINKAPLTVTADDQAITEGEPLPAFTISYSGFVNNETFDVLDIEPTASSSVLNTDVPGEFNIVVSGGMDDNYDFIYVNGTLTINEVLSAINNKPEIEIYPNPTTDYLVISQKVSKIEVYSIKGDLVTRNSNTSTINFSKLKNGFYLIKLSDETGFVLLSTKIIKR